MRHEVETGLGNRGVVGVWGGGATETTGGKRRSETKQGSAEKGDVGGVFGVWERQRERERERGEDEVWAGGAGGGKKQASKATEQKPF